MPTDADLGPVARRYLDALIAVFVRRSGVSIGPGTTIVPSADRTDSDAAVAYLLPDRTIVACGPHLVSRLAGLAGSERLDESAIVGRLEAVGGRHVGAGVNRVLEQRPIAPIGDVTGLSGRWLERDRPDDVTVLARFVDDVPDDDLDEAELSLDQLDPAIHVLVDDASGEVAAYASGRPWEYGPDFDDIGVVVHPAFRRRGLGARVVHDYAVARLPDVPQLYRHDADNAGSSRLSASLGFAEVHRLVAVELGSG